MTNSVWIKKLGSVLFLGFLIAAVGCRETATTSSQSTSPQPGTLTIGSQAEPVELTASSLTGVWIGEAILDKQKLQKKISQLDPEAQKLVNVQLKSFLSTMMAMEFRANGTVENAVEIRAANGKLLQDSSVGSWRVMESKPNGLLVQTQERLADGRVVSDQMFYQFSGDRNQIAIKVPVAGELQDCDAMIVFNRQASKSTNIATRLTGTQTK